MSKLKIQYGYDPMPYTHDKYYASRVELIGCNGESRTLSKIDCDDVSDRGEGGHAYKVAKFIAESQAKFFGCDIEFIGNFD